MRRSYCQSAQSKAILFFSLLLVSAELLAVPGEEFAAERLVGLDGQCSNDTAGLVGVEQCLGGVEVNELCVLLRDHSLGA